MLLRVVRYKFTDVSEVLAAFIIRAMSHRTSSEHPIRKVVQVYGSIFDSALLKKKKLLYGSEDFKGKSSY
jgi:hypothetical protein